MSGTQGGDDGMGDDEGLMDEIKAKLKDPYLMDLKAQKVYVS